MAGINGSLCETKRGSSVSYTKSRARGWPHEKDRTPACLRVLQKRQFRLISAGVASMQPTCGEISSFTHVLEMQEHRPPSPGFEENTEWL